MKEVPDLALYENERYPHCDPSVLHAPGTCGYCDANPRAQASRLLKGVNFTGQQVAGRALCPSDLIRGVGGAHVWGGNRPKPAATPSVLAGLFVVLWQFHTHVELMHDGVETCHFDNNVQAERAAREHEYSRNFKFVVVRLP